MLFALACVGVLMTCVGYRPRKQLLHAFPTFKPHELIHRKADHVEQESVLDNFVSVPDFQKVLHEIQSQKC